MKLSEIKGTKAMDVIAELIDPIASIAEDKDAIKMFKLSDVPEGMTKEQYTVKRIRESLPVLMRSHQKEIVKIMSVLMDVSEEDYIKDMSILTLIRDVSDMVSDPVFFQLFH